jgi:general secretion pathway protein G
MNSFIFALLIVFAAATNVCREAAAKEDDSKLTGEKIEFYLGMYKVDCNEFPLTKDGLAALVKKPEGKCPNWGPDPYVSRVPRDPWGHDWQYSSDGKTFTLKSFGKDGKPGGTGDNADVTFNTDFRSQNH